CFPACLGRGCHRHGSERPRPEYERFLGAGCEYPRCRPVSWQGSWWCHQLGLQRPVHEGQEPNDIACIIHTSVMLSFKTQPMVGQSTRQASLLPLLGTAPPQTFEIQMGIAKHGC